MTLEERVAKLEKILGNWDTPPVLSTGGTPTALPNGRYDLKESDYQLHAAVDDLAGYGTVKGKVPEILERLNAIEGASKIDAVKEGEDWFLLYTPSEA